MAGGPAYADAIYLEIAIEHALCTSLYTPMLAKVTVGVTFTAGCAYVHDD